MNYVLSILIGYLLGCSSMSFYISKIKKVDIKGQGSKNYGASNTTMIAGKKAGLLVLVHDILKAAIAVLICKFIFGETFGAIAGCASVVGHIFPFYLKFNGGKGFASFIGAAVFVSPIYSLLILVFALILALVSDYIVSATFSFITIVPVCMFFISNITVAISFVVISVIVWVKHYQNLVNLVTKNGKESKISPVLFKKKEKKL